MLIPESEKKHRFVRWKVRVRGGFIRHLLLASFSTIVWMGSLSVIALLLVYAPFMLIEPEFWLIVVGGPVSITLACNGAWNPIRFYKKKFKVWHGSFKYKVISKFYVNVAADYAILLCDEDAPSYIQPGFVIEKRKLDPSLEALTDLLEMTEIQIEQLFTMQRTELNEIGTKRFVESERKSKAAKKAKKEAKREARRRKRHQNV